MKRVLFALGVMTVGLHVLAIGADVGVSVRVGEPGFYGRIDIGNFPAANHLPAAYCDIDRAQGEMMR